jgi:hypothetical protein
MPSAATTHKDPLVAYSEAIPTAPTAHRAAGAADADTDLSSAGFGSVGLESIDNRMSLAVWVEFATAAASCTLQVAFYDAAGAPLFLSEVLTFTATAQRKSASGTYLAARQIVDCAGAAKYKVQRLTISSGNVTVGAVPI